MKNSNEAHELELLNQEERHAVTGKAPTAQNIDTEIYKDFYTNWTVDLAKAKIQGRSEVADLLKLRIDLFKGDFAKAEKLIESIRSQNLDPKMTSELMFEQARLLVFKGQWAQASRICQEALNLESAGLTRLSLLQVKALCLFEMGSFAQCTQDLELAVALTELYKDTISGFYSEILKIKVQYRDDLNANKLKLVNKLFSDQRSGPMDLNKLSSLLRLIVDIRRIQLKDHFDEALASLLVHEQLKENLYIHLSQLELVIAGAALETRLLPLISISEFDRVKSLLSETQSSHSSITTTGSDLLNFKSNFKTPSLPAFRQIEKFDSREVIEYVHIPELELLFRLEPWQIIKLTELENRILEAVSSNISKAELFSKVWKLPTFRPHRHDQLIWNAISKLRKRTGVKIKMADGQISSTNHIKVRINE